MNNYLIPDGVYQVLKWTGLIALPAVATFVATVGEAWGWDAALCDAVVATLNAAGVLMGALIAASAVKGSNG